MTGRYMNYDRWIQKLLYDNKASQMDCKLNCNCCSINNSNSKFKELYIYFQCIVGTFTQKVASKHLCINGLLSFKGNEP